jgi:hypothetical protein
LPCVLLMVHTTNKIFKIFIKFIKIIK